MTADVTRVIDPTQTARWKRLRRLDGEDAWRAVCGGRTGTCPGSLGVLLTLGPGTYGGGDISELQDLYEELLTAIDKGKSTPVEIDIDAMFERIRTATVKYTEKANTSEPKFKKHFEMELGISSIMCMSADDAPHEPGTERRKRPRSLYYGFEDSGYRITEKGKRNRDGQRVGRRPFLGPRDKSIIRMEQSPDADLFKPTGPVLFPPCKIWCRVCGELNLVEVPPGVELATVFPGAGQEDHGAPSNE